MSSLTTYNGLSVLTPEPSASGGKAINDNFKALSTPLQTTNPGATNDSSQGYSVGSRWWNSSTKFEWICTDHTVGSAVWHSIGVIPTLQQVTDAGATTTDGITVGRLTASSFSSDGGAVSTDGSGNLTLNGTGTQVIGRINIGAPVNADVVLKPNDGGYLNLNGNGGVAIQDSGLSIDPTLGIATAFGDFIHIAGKNEPGGFRNFIFQNGGAAEIMRLTGHGSLGVGTTSPATLLDVAGDSSSNTFIAKPQSAAPSSPVVGQIYYNSTTNHFFGWNGTAWKQLDN